MVQVSARALALVRPFRLRASWLGIAGLSLLLGTVTAQAQEEATSSGVPGYFRVDTDGNGTQIWFGATHRYRGTDITSDVYLVGETAELDLGVAFAAGENLVLSPMGGVTLDLGTMNVAGVLPQFYVYWTAGRWYLESWETAFFAVDDQYGPDLFADRTFLLYSLSDGLALGPHAELSVHLEDTDADSRLANLAVGGAAQLGYGDSNTLLLFLGYETREDARAEGDGIAGRVTFVREW